MENLGWSHVVRLAELDRTRDARFEILPDDAARAALAQELGVDALRKLRFTGALRPEGARDLVLIADLGATAVQTCVVSGAPVTTRIDEEVRRIFTADPPDLSGLDEVEMPDDSIDALPDTLDLGAVMQEALAIALPDYPRAEGVELGEAVFAAPGIEPLTGTGNRPFAALSALRAGGAGNRDEDD